MLSQRKLITNFWQLGNYLEWLPHKFTQIVKVNLNSTEFSFGLEDVIKWIATSGTQNTEKLTVKYMLSWGSLCKPECTKNDVTHMISLGLSSFQEYCQKSNRFDWEQKFSHSMSLRTNRLTVQHNMWGFKNLKHSLIEEWMLQDMQTELDSDHI